MPYPNEHACRLRDPDDFQDDPWARVEREHDGKKYSVIRGKLKSSGDWEDQAFRYPKDTWTENAARAHCQSHDGIEFEPASGKGRRCQMMEYKACPSEFKTSGDQGEYEGHFSVFHNVDEGQDVVHPGAFLKTIQERASRVKVFYAHDWDKLIGPPPSILREDEIGLFAAGRLTLKSFWGNETWQLMKDRALTEGSFGFRAIKHKFDDENIRHLHEVKLYEISPVPLGMNPLTAVRAVKALLYQGTDETAFEALLALLEEIREGRALVTATPDQVRPVMEALKVSLEALNEYLEAAEPAQPRHSALLQKRLRAAELALAFIRT